MSELEVPQSPAPQADDVTLERKNGMGMFMPTTGEAGVFQSRGGSMFYRDSDGVVTPLGASAYSPEDSVENPVPEAVVAIVGSPERPVPLFITGPPVGTEDDYVVAIATGEPDYRLLFLISSTGQVAITPSDEATPALTITSAASDDTTVLQVSSALGDLLTLKADGSFKLIQPGVGTVFEVTSDGETAFGGTDPSSVPEIPASPTAQDVVDVLLAKGLATQAEA